MAEIKVVLSLDTAPMAAAFRGMVRQAHEAAREMARQMGAALQTEIAVPPLDMAGLDAAIAETEAEFERFRTEAEDPVTPEVDPEPATTALGGITTSVREMSESMFFLREAVGASFRATAENVRQASAPFIDFEQRLANVNTLLGEGADAGTLYKEGLYGLVGETNRDLGDLTDGLYQVVSAFGAADDNLAVLETNARAAAAGMATTTDAINLTSSVTKAYGDTSAAAVQQVSDLAFEAVRMGQTTFPELAASMGRVTPLAQELRVSQGELFAVMATATGVTGPAAEVSTQYRAALQSLLTPTAEMTTLLDEMGLASGRALVEQEGFGGAMRLVVEEARAADVPLQSYLGSIEAQTLALALAGPQADTYVEKLGEMSNVAGATDRAFGRATATLGSSLQNVSNQMEVFRASAFDASDGVVMLAVDGLGRFLGGLNELDPALKGTILGMQLFAQTSFELAVSGLLPAVAHAGDFVRAARAAATAVRAWAVANRALLLSLGVTGVIAALASFVAQAVLAEEASDDLRDSFRDQREEVRGLIGDLHALSGTQIFQREMQVRTNIAEVKREFAELSDELKRIFADPRTQTTITDPESGESVTLDREEAITRLREAQLALSRRRIGLEDALAEIRERGAENLGYQVALLNYEVQTLAEQGVETDELIRKRERLAELQERLNALSRSQEPPVSPPDRSPDEEPDDSSTSRVELEEMAARNILGVRLDLEEAAARGIMDIRLDLEDALVDVDLDRLEHEKEILDRRNEQERQAAEERLRMAEQYALRLLDGLEDALLYERRYSDEEIALQREHYQRQEDDLNESLAKRQIEQEEYDRRMRELALARADFSEQVAQDQASALTRISLSTLDVLKQVAIESIRAELAKAAAKVVAPIIKALGPLGIPVAAGAIAAILALENTIRSAAGFRLGGYTGAGDPDEVAGVVHRGEVVLEAGLVRNQVNDVLAIRQLLRQGISAADLVRLAGAPGPDLASLSRTATAIRPAAPALTLSAGGDEGLLVAELRALRREQTETRRMIERTGRDQQQALHAAGERIERAGADPHAARRARHLAARTDRLIDPRGRAR